MVSISLVTSQKMSLTSNSLVNINSPDIFTFLTILYISIFLNYKFTIDILPLLFYILTGKIYMPISTIFTTMYSPLRDLF